MILRTLLCFFCLFFTTLSFAQPKVAVKHQRDSNNLAEIQLINQTSKELVCYVSIDGYKLYFRLLANQPSQWYRATDPRFNYTNFSSWCDYLSLHPDFAKVK